MVLQLNEAISKRLVELLEMYDMTQYQLYKNSGVYKSTIGNVVNCTHESVQLRIVHEICQGLRISVREFFNSPLFDDNNLDP